MSAGTTAISLREAQELARILVADLAPHCTRIEVAGSIRRGKAWVNDIEIVCIPKEVPIPAVADLFGNEERPAGKERDPGFAEVVKRYAETLVKGQPSTGKYMQLITRTGVKVDLFTATRENWGYIFAIRTGSAEFSQSLAWRWKKMGYEGKEGMLTRFGKPVPLAEERDLFQLLQLPWVQPNDR
jgi:DNA polymerase/3'-5' exonuclease PolX